MSPLSPAPWPLGSLTAVLRRERVGGALLVGAAALGLLSANAPWSEAYAALGTWTVGPASLHLALSPAAWASDGLLAVFFFVAGLELKQELVAGELADRTRALVPVAAAVAGMAVPAGIFLAVTVAGGAEGAARGWAVPTATDIAFALAVLAVVAPRGPGSRRAFLLTLAVVDDLLAITIIAVAYTDRLAVVPLLGAVLALATFALVVRWRPGWWWLLLPLAVLTWGLVHASGVHATVAGVLLGLVVPVVRADGGRPGGPGTAARYEHRWRPVTNGVAVPVFAFLAAGVPVSPASLAGAVTDGVTWGVVLGLVVGKTVGVAGTAWALPRMSRARLADDLEPVDLLGLGLLAGVGFTVSLLIGELAFGSGTAVDDHARIGILAGSLAAAGLAALVVRAADRRRPQAAAPS